MEKKDIKLTKEHYALFKKEYKKWVDFMGLSYYNLVFEWKKLEGADAQNALNHQGNTATITLSTEIGNFDYEMGVENYIKDTAKHEALHLLLAR